MKAEFHFSGEPVAFAVAEPDAPPATKQDIFDRVVQHYRKQPSRCTGTVLSSHGTKNEGCVYRAPDGRACFVGALMTDEEVTRAVNMGVKMLIDTGASPTWMVQHRDFLSDIQALHDTTTNWPYGRMPMVLELFAAERGLVMPD